MLSILNSADRKPPLSQAADRRSAVCSLALLLCAALPLLTEVKPLFSLLFILTLALRSLLAGHPRIRTAVMLFLLLCSAAAVHLTSENWLSSDAVLPLLLMVLSLKWLEADTLREYRFLILASLLLAAISSLWFSGLPALSYLLLIAVLGTITLFVVNDPLQVLRLPALSLSALRLMLLALPVTALLFVSVPRIQGPLWDMGLILGLPIELAIDEADRGIALKTTLKTGQISRVSKSDAPVLVAEFADDVPYKSQMYWRGPVFTDYVNNRWQLPDGWDNRSQLLRKAIRGKQGLGSLLTEKSEKLHYEARVTPHGQRWLFALDLPSGRTPEAFISGDMQLLSIRRLDREFKYDVDAWLSYSGGPALSEQQRLRYLRYPQNSNPRLKRWGEQLARDNLNPDDRLQALYQQLASGGFQLSQTSDIAEDSDNLDRFFFEERTGTIEHLTSTTALILRAAGIPSRLITGYRGGSLIALTNFVVVRQNHAHAWVEAWLPDKGWVRVEAKDFVAPPEPEQRTAGNTLKKKAEKKPAAQASNREPNSSAPEAGATGTSAPKGGNDDSNSGGGSTFSWLKSLSNGMETWLVNYNPDRQTELMKSTGLRRVDWKSLAATVLIGLLVLALIYGALLNRRSRPQDPVERSFNQLSRKLNQLGLGCAETHCHSQWLAEIADKKPEAFPAIREVVHLYGELRYGPSPSAELSNRFRREVKRLVAML